MDDKCRLPRGKGTGEAEADTAYGPGEPWPEDDDDSERYGEGAWGSKRVTDGE